MKNKTYTLKELKQGERDPNGKLVIYKKLFYKKLYARAFSKNGRYEKIS